MFERICYNPFMDSFSPALSICIPTYNRADILRQTLEHLVSQPVFRETREIEIVVSDNASTDSTPHVCAAFVHRFPSRIRVFRNAENICDANFEKVLSYGQGHYLKLANDTCLFTEEGLREMISIIREYANQQDRPSLLFARSDIAKRHVVCRTLDELLNDRSYMITWIGDFGMWRTERDLVSDFARKAETKLTQVDALLRLFRSRKNMVVFHNVYTHPYPRKAIIDYSPSRIFGRNYLDLLNEYVVTGDLTRRAFNRERKRVFKGLLLPANLSLNRRVVYLHPEYVRPLFKYYKACWYYYAVLPFVCLARVLRRLGIRYGQTEDQILDANRRSSN